MDTTSTSITQTIPAIVLEVLREACVDPIPLECDDGHYREHFRVMKCIHCGVDIRDLSENGD